MANLQIPDAVLVQNYISGDEKAFATLLKRHQSKIYSFIYERVKDRDVSDDIFQDAFVKIIKNIKSDSYKENGKFFSWALRIVHNEVMDYFRENAKMPKSRDSEIFSHENFLKDGSLSVEDVYVNDGISLDLKLLVEKLPENQKEVIKLRIYSGLNFREISEQTNISLNTVIGNMRYAVKNLKKLIKKNKIDVTEYNIL